MGWVVNAMPRPLYPRERVKHLLDMRLARPQGKSVLEWKISPSPEFGPRTVQGVASPCTHHALPSIKINHEFIKGPKFFIEFYFFFVYRYSFRLQVQACARHIVLKLRSQQYPASALLKLLMSTEF